MQGTLIEKLTTSKTVTLTGTGKWVSKAQLEETYAQEPQRLEAILKNTRSWYDSIGELELYEDMEYVTEMESRTKRELEESWSSTVHDRVKRVKTPKPPAEVKTEDGGADAQPPEDLDGAKPLNVSQAKWVEKFSLRMHQATKSSLSSRMF